MSPRCGDVHRATKPTLAINEVATAAQAAPDFQSSASLTFGCSQCQKDFNRRENLSRHLKTHDAAPSHRCAKCDKAFTRSDLLKRHELGHQRWDKKGHTAPNATGSAKRRRVAFEDSVTPNEAFSSSPWSPEDQVMAASTSSPQGFHQSVQNDHTAGNVTARDSHPITGNVQKSDQTSNSAFQSMSSVRTHHQYSPEHDFHRHHLLQSINHYAVADELLPDFQDLSQNGYLPFGPFDFSSFLLPPGPSPVGNEWFSNDFYSAMRETGNEWGGLGKLLDPNFLSPGQDDEFTSVNSDIQNYNTHQAIPEVEQTQDDSSEYSNGEGPHNQGRISRISSPPNEASEEDKWPFQWNPNSRPILKANPLIIPDNHPLLQNHKSRYDISEGTLLRLRAFLKPPAGREFHQSQKGSFVLPSLPIINVFICLFFEHFSPQMPVLHHPTVNTNADLPPPLLAAMVIIGAIHSHLEHTRRFSIVLLDIVRWNLQIALECDNSLMREPMIIFAEALICHAGLWCGNKRAFELAEVVRGAAVTHIRRVHASDRANLAAGELLKGNLNAQWRRWVAEESQRRLYWTIYALDAQFPSLLNLPATIAIGEVSDLGCPCDEEFWCASSARNWKNLLGPASVPPSRSFSAAVGPFVLSPGRKLAPNGRSLLSVLDLNPWSAFIILMTIQTQIFQFSQESLLARTFFDDDEPLKGDGDAEQQSYSGENLANETSCVLEQLQAARRDQLADALASWAITYSAPRSSAISYQTSQHFHAASIVVYHLSNILLDIDLSDLQNAIGKDGTAGMSQAMSNLSLWARKFPHIAECVALNAVKTIVLLAPTQTLRDHSAPYSIIALFLCHVVLWVSSSVSPPAEKQRLLEEVEKSETLRSSHFFGVLKSGMSLKVPSSDSKNSGNSDAPKVLFKSAAEMLTQLGTWGASLNLALLIHRRAEMQ